MSSSVVLLSSGLDSTVNLFAALRETEVRMILTFDYGQRAAPAEIRQARALISAINKKREVPLRHEIIELPFFKGFTQTSLVNSSVQVPVAEEVAIDDLGVSKKSAARVWVPNRNGIFLNIAAAYAEGLGADFVVPGFNAEEAVTFADNTAEFLAATENALAFSTASGVKTKCWTLAMTKPEIVAYAKKIQADLSFVWPCYFDGEVRCGSCESCQRFERATRNYFLSNLPEHP